MAGCAFILVDHGSRREQANAVLEELAATLTRDADMRVYAAHMDLARPTIADAFDRAAGDGVESVVVVPYFLVPGRHSDEDVPRLCAEAAMKHPGLTWRCARPIGLDPRMIQFVRDRLEREQSAGGQTEHNPSGDEAGL